MPDALALATGAALVAALVWPRRHLASPAYWRHALAVRRLMREIERDDAIAADPDGWAMAQAPRLARKGHIAPNLRGTGYVLRRTHKDWGWQYWGGRGDEWADSPVAARAFASPAAVYEAFSGRPLPRRDA